MEDDAYAQILIAPEAEAYVQGLFPVDVDEIGTPRWFSQHEHLEKLNMQAALHATSMQDEFVKDYIILYEKVSVLVHNLVALECWEKNVFPIINREIKNCDASFQLYMALHHQLTLTGLLEILSFHSEVCQSAEDVLPDIVDFCHRQIVQLFESKNSNSTVFLRSFVERREGDKRLAAMSGEEEMTTVCKRIQFQVGFKTVSILCFIVEHLEELPLSIRDRILNTHDSPMALVHLLETMPWECQSTENGKLYVYDGAAWHCQITEGQTKIDKTEAQVWIALMRVITDPDNRRKYEINDFRKARLIKIRPRLSVVLEQLPCLSHFRRTLEELTLFQPPPAKKDLIMEQIPIIFEAINLKWQGKWKEIAKNQSENVFNVSPVLMQEQAKLLSELYNMDTLAEFIDDPHKCAQCGVKGIKRCGRCLKVWYCNRDCQVNHWPTHKLICITTEEKGETQLKTDCSKTE